MPKKIVIKNKPSETLPEFLKAFGETVEDIIKYKTSETQVRDFPAKEPPAVVTMSMKDCKTLCTKAGVTYKDGYESRVLRYTCSDETPDRYGDIVRQKGWEFKNYKKNPVVMGFHNYGTFPVGNALKFWVEDGKLKMWILFADAEDNADADTAFKMAKSGFMKAGSVGFLPLETKELTPDEKKAQGMTPWGIEFTKQDLMEFSVCGVPANPNAVQDAISKGIVSKKAISKFVPEEVMKKVTLEDSEVEEEEESDEIEKKVSALVKKSLKEYFKGDKSKAGEVLSKKNKGILENVLKSMDEASKSLKEFLDSVNKADVTEEEEEEEEPPTENPTTDKAEPSDDLEINFNFDESQQDSPDMYEELSKANDVLNNITKEFN